MSAFIGDVEPCEVFGQCQVVAAPRALVPLFQARCICGWPLKDNWANDSSHYFSCENTKCACWRYGMLARIDWRVSYLPLSNLTIENHYADAGPYHVPITPEGVNAGWFVDSFGNMQEITCRLHMPTVE